jgi:hypothetical protein
VFLFKLLNVEENEFEFCFMQLERDMMVKGERVALRQNRVNASEQRRSPSKRDSCVLLVERTTSQVR